MEEKYSGLIWQHALENILNVSQRFTKLLHQQTKPHVLVGQFNNIQKKNNEAYDYIEDFFHQRKEDIGEPIARRYVIDITGMTTRDDNNEKLLLPQHTSKHQYYVNWYFECGYIFKKNI